MGLRSHEQSNQALVTIRLDKWLWAARFFKTRGLAQQAIEAGRVLVDGERVKVARALRAGEGVTERLAAEPEGDVAAERVGVREIDALPLGGPLGEAPEDWEGDPVAEREGSGVQSSEGG